MEENVFYKPGEPSSVMSLNEEVDLFASCVNIYTTETDVYGDIMDEPHLRLLRSRVQQSELE